MKKYWEKIKKIVYPSSRANSGNNNESKTTEVIESTILKLSFSKTNLLDAGCKSGIEAIRLYEKGFKGFYYGVDDNVKEVKKAKKKLKNNSKIKFFKEDLNHLNFKNSFFDVVLMKDIIEENQYYTKILNEVSRVCKKCLILSMSVKPSIFLGDKIKLQKNGIYLNRYNQGKLFSFLRKLHFKKIKKIYEDWQDITYLLEK